MNEKKKKKKEIHCRTDEDEKIKMREKKKHEKGRKAEGTQLDVINFLTTATTDVFIPSGSASRYFCFPISSFPMSDTLLHYRPSKKLKKKLKKSLLSLQC